MISLRILRLDDMILGNTVGFECLSDFVHLQDIVLVNVGYRRGDLGSVLLNIVPGVSKLHVIGNVTSLTLDQTILKTVPL